MNGAGVRALLTGAPIGIAVRDTDLRCTWVNDALALQDGIPREKRLGRRLTEVLPGPEAESVEAVMRLVLHSSPPGTCRAIPSWSRTPGPGHRPVDRMGTGGAGRHHRTHRQRAGHQRRTPRRRSHHPSPHPGTRRW
ncbi:PAS domain-containing protein [Streptomyces sp. NPDC059629]|uniref:PAS domain-containing protein n=1 Tax=Streptomyces sp. NPDC059629 TaxID=3346889 RepID=UPI0036AF7201